MVVITVKSVVVCCKAIAINAKKKRKKNVFLCIMTAIEMA